MVCSVLIKKEEKLHLFDDLNYYDLIEIFFKTNLFYNKSGMLLIPFDYFKRLKNNKNISNYELLCSFLIIDMDSYIIYSIGFEKKDLIDISRNHIINLIEDPRYTFENSIDLSEKRINSVLDVGLINDQQLQLIIKKDIEYFKIDWASMGWEFYFCEKENYDKILSVLSHLLDKNWQIDNDILKRWKLVIENLIEEDYIKSSANMFNNTIVLWNEKKELSAFYINRIYQLPSEIEVNKIKESICSKNTEKSIERTGVL